MWLAVAAGLALAALPACHRPRRDAPAPVEATSSRVDVFLRCTDATARELGFSVAAVELVDEGGASRALATSRRQILATDASRRLPLAGSIVPPARYVKLRVTLDGAWLDRGDGRQALELESTDPTAEDVLTEAKRSYELPLDLRLRERDAASIFVDWQAADSLRGGAGFAPSFTTSLERPQTTLGMLFVADAGSGSVLTLDRSTGQIVGTCKAGSEPSALALARDRRRLCVANAGDGSLSIVDVRQGHVESSFAIGFSAGTSDVVLADLDRFVAAANPALDSVTFATLAPGGTAQSVAVGRSPTRLTAAPSLGRLYVCESGGDSVSVIDTNSRSVVTTVSVESQPSDVEIDRDELELFVGHRTSPNLLVLDARSLAVSSTVFIGGDVTDVLADPQRSRIYIARSRPAEVLVVERRLGSIVRRIPVSGRIQALALTLEGSRLYGVVPEKGTLLSIDLVLGKEEAAIPCGSRPMDVVIAE
ncbi:MAG: YncE family protein [Planctomycetes bacterium]|nr:YncE family protein [Planctomycetota bacterium]